MSCVLFCGVLEICVEETVHFFLILSYIQRLAKVRMYVTSLYVTFVTQDVCNFGLDATPQGRKYVTNKST